LANGWNRETVDSHIVGGNTVCHCEQASIIGSLGAAFSKIFGNVILPYHGLDPQLLEQMLVHPAHVTRQAFTENGHELARTDLEGTLRDQNGVVADPWNKKMGGFANHAKLMHLLFRCYVAFESPSHASPQIVRLVIRDLWTPHGGERRRGHLMRLDEKNVCVEILEERPPGRHPQLPRRGIPTGRSSWLQIEV
jgi:hypothetical protein